MVTAGSANIRFAPIAPTMHQATWAGRVGRVGRGITPGRSAERSIDERRDRVEATAGHRPNIRMIANNPAAVAAAFSSSSRPVSPGDQPLRGDPGADYWRGQESTAQELGSQPQPQRHLAHARTPLVLIDNHRYSA